MKRIVYAALLLLLLALTFLGGKWYGLSTPVKTADSERRVLYYVDPMNPAHTSAKPGIAPCGMKMEPVYADPAPQGQAQMTATEPMPPGTVRITQEKQQLIGVKTGVVEKTTGTYSIRTVGRVAPDEKRVYRLVAGADGWIRETYNNDTGTFVKKDQRLASFYNPQVRAAQLAYLSTLGAGDDRPQTVGRPGLAPSQQASVTLQTYVDALESLGMSEYQMKELASTRQITDRIYILAPATGFILARNVSPGQRFDKGTEWYRIADLSRVWVLADLFRNEATLVRPGTTARVVLPHDNKEFKAVVRDVLPQVDPNSRTMKVRLEADNPGMALRPDAFVDAEFPVSIPSAVAVPAEAVLDSGLRRTIFVDRGNGYFEPRQVETGVRLGDRVEITKGLMAGERIVVSGNFLIDSESRIRMASAGAKSAQTVQAASRAKDPVCGMEVDPGQAKSAGRAIDFQGTTYYFCMDECKSSFRKDPARYAGKREDKSRELTTGVGATGRKGHSDAALGQHVHPASAPSARGGTDIAMTPDNSPTSDKSGTSGNPIDSGKHSGTGHGMP